MKPFSSGSVIQDNIKTTTCSDYELLKAFVGMSTSRFTRWYVIKVINPLNLEGYVPILLDEGEISPGIGYLWEVYDFTF